MQPKVSIVSRPQIDWSALEGYLAGDALTWVRAPEMSDADALVEFAGRVCYMSFGEKQHRQSNAAYIANLVTQGHGSVLEHAAWTFVLSGVSRAFTHQLVRHRVGFSFSQLSQQYADHSTTTFVRPSELDDDPEAAAVWQEAVESAQNSYISLITLLERNTPRRGKEARRAIASAARAVLPNATETTIVVTANARALRHFLEQRGAIEGDAEMRRVCSALLCDLKREAPSLFADFVVERLEDGSPIVRQVRTEPAVR